MLDWCSAYAIEHLLTCNGSKSYSLCFEPKHIKFHDTPFYLNKLEIPRVDQCERGSMVSTKNCDIDMKRQMRKFYANINILSRKFSKCPPYVKCMSFKSNCPTMYCSIMWYNCTVTAMRKISISYNNSLRRLQNILKYNSASEMFVNLYIKPFGELIRNNIHSFMNRLQCSKNLLLSYIYIYM